MSLWKYIKSKATQIICIAFIIISIIVMGYTFRANKSYIFGLVFIVGVCSIICFWMDFAPRKKYFDQLVATLDKMDQKYLISEMDISGDFLEAEIFGDVLYETDKSMKEHINEIENSTQDFKEYLEMWVHEIKLPLAALGLMNHNENFDAKKQKLQIDKLDSYVDQILYYVRAGASEKDYLMRKCNLEKVINNVVKANKTLLIAERFIIKKENTDVEVITDAKWLEFVVTQIVGNSVKYKDNSKETTEIKFSVLENDRTVSLIIEDNGIGINNDEIERVFEKSFTGENGRIGEKSTGMGLYICKNLFDKMGHRIAIESKKGKYTRVILEFGKNDFYKEVV